MKIKYKHLSLEETRKLLGASKSNRKFVFMHPFYFILMDVIGKGHNNDKNMKG